jgi:4-alpha-glucanotransferase
MVNNPLQQILQKSYTDNAGKRVWAGKNFLIAAKKCLGEMGPELCEPVQVVAKGTTRIEVTLKCATARINASWFILRDEDGNTLETGAIEFLTDQKIGIPLNRPLPLGSFDLYFSVRDDAGEESKVSQLLICAPSKAHQPIDHRVINVLAVQLYGLRSTGNWGIGDFGDLETLARKAEQAGYRYIMLNPVHMTHVDAHGDISPYSPESRLLLNWLYLDIAALDFYREWRDEIVAEWPGEAGFFKTIAALRQQPYVDYDQVARMKFWFLTRYCRRYWALIEYGLFNGELEVFLHRNEKRISAKVAAMAGTVEGEKTEDFRKFHLLTQWCCEQQLARCFPPAGSIKPIFDLAIGVRAQSCEVRSRPESYVSSMSLGAPGDDFNPDGQCWNIVPFNPVQLRKNNYSSLIELLVANMPIGGGIRIDHVMWMIRQFWIVDGCSVGGYVLFKVDEILAIVRLLSWQRQCLVIGEDLGTIPRGFRSRLAQSGIYRMKVLPFEEKKDIGKNYPPHIAAFIGTHDLPLFCAMWRGEQAFLLREAGLISGEEPGCMKSGQNKIREMITAIVGDKKKAQSSGEAYQMLRRHLANRRPALLVEMLDDVLGETLPVNIPGTVDEYPNWRRKIATGVDDISLPRVDQPCAGGRSAKSKYTN